MCYRYFLKIEDCEGVIFYFLKYDFLHPPKCEVYILVSESKIKLCRQRGKKEIKMHKTWFNFMKKCMIIRIELN